MSVVDSSFEQLKRFNLAEIYEPTPKDVVREVREKLVQPGDMTGEQPAAVSTSAVEEPTPSSMDLS